MQLEPTELRWLYPEMKELFDKLSALRDEVWSQCRVELGDNMPGSATASEIGPRRIVRDPIRRAVIIESYRKIAAGYEAKMASLVGQYTAPQVILKRD